MQKEIRVRREFGGMVKLNGRWRVGSRISMMHEADHVLGSAVEQLQSAVSQARQQDALEARMWQKEAQELQSMVESLEARLEEARKAHSQLQTSLGEKSAELNELMAVNANLTRACQQKDQSISKFMSLNQSLKGLLEAEPVSSTSFEPECEAPTAPTPPQTFHVQQSSPGFSEPPSYSARNFQTPTPPVMSPPASKSAGFIRTAKERLTYTTFNQMIAEINAYNRHSQTKETTIRNVRALLTGHTDLFEQFLGMIGGAC
jgi:small-conductance mechanosensitive channel